MREIDLGWNTGFPGGLQHRRNEAYMTRKKYVRLDRQPDGEVEWVERRSSVRLGAGSNRDEGSNDEDSRDGNNSEDSSQSNNGGKEVAHTTGSNDSDDEPVRINQAATMRVFSPGCYTPPWQRRESQRPSQVQVQVLNGVKQKQQMSRSRRSSRVV